MKAVRICEYGGTGTLKLEEALRIFVSWESEWKRELIVEGS